MFSVDQWTDVEYKISNIYTASRELAGTNQEASSIGLIYVFISSRIELH